MTNELASRIIGDHESRHAAYARTGSQGVDRETDREYGVHEISSIIAYKSKATFLGAREP